MFNYSYKTAVELVKLLESVHFQVSESPYVLTQTGAHTDPTKGQFEYLFTINPADPTLIQSVYQEIPKISHWKEAYKGDFEIGEENAKAIFEKIKDDEALYAKLLFIDEDFGLLSDEVEELLDAPDKVAKEEKEEVEIEEEEKQLEDTEVDGEYELDASHIKTDKVYKSDMVLTAGDSLLIDHIIKSIEDNVIIFEDGYSIENDKPEILGFVSGEQSQINAEIETKQQEFAVLVEESCIDFSTIVKYVERRQSTESTVSND